MYLTEHLYGGELKELVDEDSDSIRLIGAVEHLNPG